MTRPSGARTSLRRAAVAFGAVWVGESAAAVALVVVAFQAGGLAAVGAVTAVRMAAAAALAPFLGALADRVRRERVLTAVGVVRAVTLGGAALVTAIDGPAALTLALVAVATVALTLFRPAHSALPALAHSPADLAGANAVRGVLDSLTTFGGPLAAAALLTVGGATGVFAAAAVVSLVGGLVVVALPHDAPPRGEAVRVPVRREVLEGLGVIVRDRTARLITLLGAVQTFTRGALSVFVVVVAIDLLDLGEPGVGLHNAAVGAGAVLGSLAGFLVVRRGGLATWFGVGITVFGAPLAGLGALPSTPTAVLLLALVGVGNALIDVSAFTVLARITDEAVLARMFTGFEAVLTLGVAAGSVLAPLLVDLTGLRAALVIVGLLAPVAVLGAGPAVRRLNRDIRVRDDDVALLRAVPMLRALPVTTLEQLGSGLSRVEVEAGADLVTAGEPGESFFVLEAGRAEVWRAGAVVNTLAVGDGFGEVALLTDGPRTATVRATTPVVAAVLGRSAFLTAVTGYPASVATGREVVEQVRARDAATGPPV